MRFEHLDILWFLWLIIPLGGVIVFFIKKRKQALSRFARGDLWKHLAESLDWKSLKLKSFLLLVVVMLTIIALARPQWGFELREVKRQGVDILLAVDVSKSMLTQDVSPNRLERTKLAIRDLVEKLSGDRVGLIAFAGDSFLLCPLTSDYAGLLMSLKDLDPSIIPRGGTNVAAAIEEAARVYEERSSKYKTLVILTDGENLESDPLAAAREAQSRGMKIYTVGIGTKEGELIRLSSQGEGGEFLKDQAGNVVKSRLNENLLQDLALTTGGFYVRASGAQFGLDVIYERALSKLEQTEFEGRMKRQYFERFQWPLGLAVILFIVEMALPVRKKNY